MTITATVTDGDTGETVTVPVNIVVREDPRQWLAETLFGKPSVDFYLGWREHDAEQVRVWRNNWHSDVFEVLPKRAIADLQLLGYVVRRPLGVCEDYYGENE